MHFRNNSARDEMLKLKQDKANSLTSQINQQRKAQVLNELKTKLNAWVIFNEVLNQLITSTINLNYPIKPIGRPKLSDKAKARREQQKSSKPKGKAGSGDRAQKMSRLFVRVKLFRGFYILKNISIHV
jgi:hypothetical protein